MRLVIPVFVALLLPALAQAQVTSLKGRFVDPTDHAPVPGVQVKLTNFADTADVRRATAKEDGSFEFTGLGVHSYRLEATRLGYGTLRQVIRVTRLGQDAGVLQMVPDAVPIAGVTVTESPAPAAQKGDTTEFRASAVKTSRDATAEDLVQKLPGVTVENGQVKAQGENVQQVLVNGRPFFGSDPTAAMRNLPAEVVDRIQVYDRMSDQAEFSGFEDGSQQRTMNFILRDQKAQFGKFYGGYGDRDRYQGGGNATLVRGGNRLTLIGMSNNINQANFSPMDLFGAMTGNGGGGGGGPRIMMMGGGHRRPSGGTPRIMRFGGGGFDPSSFFVSQQGGITTTHSGGFNYTGQWSPRLTVTSSAFLNRSDNENLQSLAREYLPPQDSLAFYGQDQTTDSRNSNQRFDARVEWTLDSLNSVILQPRLYFQGTRSHVLGFAENSTLLGDPLSSSLSDTRNAIDGHNLSNRLTLRRRFAKRGRNVSADLQVGHTLSDGNRDQVSLTDYFQPDSSTRLDQRTGVRTTTASASARIAFTERLGERWQAQLTYNPAISRSRSDARTLALDTLRGVYDLLDPQQSNSFENRYTTQAAGVAALRTSGRWRWLTQAQWQEATLRSEQTFPGSRRVRRTFGDVLPSMSLTGTFANRRNLRLSWTTSTQPPSISQLQNVLDNSNPLALSTGNPDLAPSYANVFSVRMSEADPMRSRSRFVFANVVRTTDPIANTTFTALADTVLEGVPVPRGTQITSPLNLDVSWSANAFAATSRPVGFLKSVGTLNGGLSFSENPTRVNRVLRRSRTWTVRYGTVLSSNISQNLDFTLSYQGNSNLRRNSPSTGSQGDYYSHTLGFRLNAVAAHGVVVRQELTHNLQGSATESEGRNVVLWNTTLGKKFLRDGRGELRVTATDVLRQDRSVGRSLTDTYVEDWRDRSLGRYVQAVLTYSFR